MAGNILSVGTIGITTLTNGQSLCIVGDRMGSVAQVFADNGRVTEGHFRNGFFWIVYGSPCL